MKFCAGIKQIMLFTTVLFSVSATANAATCTATDAKVTEVFQWYDGNIFVVLDKPTNCNCELNNRVAFNKADNEKFFISAAFTALATGMNVYVKAEDTGCVIHGNTAKLNVLGLKP